MCVNFAGRQILCLGEASIHFAPCTFGTFDNVRNLNLVAGHTWGFVDIVGSLSACHIECFKSSLVFLASILAMDQSLTVLYLTIFFARGFFGPLYFKISIHLIWNLWLWEEDERLAVAKRPNSSR